MSTAPVIPTSTGSTIITCGTRVRDMLTGFTGLVHSKVIHANGCVQFGVQPRVKDGEDKLPDAFSFDEQQLEYLDAGISHLYRKPVDTPVALGMTVEDVVSKHRGIATLRIEFLNGCVHFWVEGPRTINSDGKPEENKLFVPSSQLRICQVGSAFENIKHDSSFVKAQKAAAEKVRAAPTAKPPGGPIRRAERM